jgi:predicted AlkP superfamily phosphohydrolase/phosphomutase
MTSPKIMVIGLDSAPPEIVFDKLADKLTNISTLRSQGFWGELESCHPPITVPAWMVMASSKNPGKLGIYGFRHRKGPSYTEGYITSSHSVREPVMWDLLGREGIKSCLVGVPPSYPPKPINGNLISCFITPDQSKDFTYPHELKQEILTKFGDYSFDVTFRTEDRDKIMKDLFDMTKKRFQVIKHLIQTKPWNLFWLVEIGVDRVHHAFWKFFDPQHEKYVPGNKYENVIPDYYKLIDSEIGEITRLLDKDTTVVVVSDHGTKRMKGAFCINEWLIQKGYLTLKKRPEGKIDLDKADVDWSKTKAWGWGGYYARVFLNVKGREREGTIEASEYEAVRNHLSRELCEVTDPTGRWMETRVYKPEELYGTCNGDPPDLMVYFDDLYWRSAGTIGYDTTYLSENDTGPDDSVHSQHGIFIMSNSEKTFRSKISGMRITDVAPTLLKVMGREPPSMDGQAIREVTDW